MGPTHFFGKYWMWNLSDRVWYPAGLDLGQLGRALQWTPKLGFNLPPTVRQWIRVWRKHAPRLPSAASLWLSSVAASSTSQPLTFLRHFLLQSLNPLAWFSDALNWVVLHLHYFLIEFSAAGTTSATVWGFCYLVSALGGERRRGGEERRSRRSCDLGSLETWRSVDWWSRISVS